MMSSQWFYTKNNIGYGPVTSEQLKVLLQNGTLSPSDTIWRDGMKGWQPADKVTGLFPLCVARTVPPPLPPINQPNLASSANETSSTLPASSRRLTGLLIFGGILSVCVLGLIAVGTGY